MRVWSVCCHDEACNDAKSGAIFQGKWSRANYLAEIQFCDSDGDPQLIPQFAFEGASLLDI